MAEFYFYSPLVQEVIDFVNKGQFFEGVIPSKQHYYMIEKDFQKAQLYAFEQNLPHGNLCWSDIKELEMSAVYAKIYNQANYKELSKQLREVSPDFFKTLKTRLSTTYRNILDEVDSDMRGILVNRAINGLTDNLFEKIFQFYKDGGWPCGWKGDYPQGKMIVFSPF